ncbi:MAG TPA: divergent polysaccharide deacetylase family protein [Parvibaculum sp.]
MLAKPLFRFDLALGVVSLVLGVLIAQRMTALPPPPPVETGPRVPTHIGENAVDGPLVPAAPKPAAVELPAWQRNAAVMPDAPREPMIAIVLDDMGPNRKGTERALNLPAAVTFSFLPYAPDVADFVRTARARGHEIVVHVPMEPVGTADPGPHALRVSQTPDEIRANLDWDLGRFEGYVGINNHMGSRFTADAADMSVVAGDLKKRGLLLLDSRTSAQTQAANEAHKAGLPTLSRDVFLDNDDEGSAVAAEFEHLEKVARKNGVAIAIGHPRPETLDLLEKWIPEARAKGFTLVPLTAILRHREAT